MSNTDSIAEAKPYATLVDWTNKLNISALYHKFGTPAWVVSEAQLFENLKIFTSFTNSPSHLFFPVKTNPSFAILRMLAKKGAGADCASMAEIDQALLAGIPYQHISYNSPFQDITICKKMLQMGGHVVMDDPQALLSLQEDLKNQNFKGHLLIRVNLTSAIQYDNDGENQELMSHAEKSSKFGIPAEDLSQLLSNICLPVSGLHVHVGTQMDNLQSFANAINEMNALADMLNASGASIKYINLGGGLGIPFSDTDKFPSLWQWHNTLSNLKKTDYQYCVEPGHALVGNTVALMAEILTIKNSRGKKWAITNVGTDQLAKLTLLHWEHRILDSDSQQIGHGFDALAGPLCFAGDTLLRNADITSLKVGSPILICEAGAYTYSLANKFNGRLAPSWIVIKENGDEICVMNQEGIYDNAQHAYFEWNDSDLHLNQEFISKDRINDLSSKYLKSGIADDEFAYISMLRLSKNSYSFKISARSGVSFISMPFAIRIFGDASIIALLHSLGCSKKEISVWGRKLTLDCFDIIPTDSPLEFTVSLSEIKEGNSGTIISRFKTACKRCSGSFVLKL